LYQEKPLPLREGSAKITRILSFNCNKKRSNNAAFDEASRYKTVSYNTGGVNVDHFGRIINLPQKIQKIFQVQVFE
jgi:hypothetical protein